MTITSVTNDYHVCHQWLSTLSSITINLCQISLHITSNIHQLYLLMVRDHLMTSDQFFSAPFTINCKPGTGCDINDLCPLPPHCITSIVWLHTPVAWWYTSLHVSQSTTAAHTHVALLCRQYEAFSPDLLVWKWQFNSEILGEYDTTPSGIQSDPIGRSFWIPYFAEYKPCPSGFVGFFGFVCIQRTCTQTVKVRLDITTSLQYR